MIKFKSLPIILLSCVFVFTSSARALALDPPTAPTQPTAPTPPPEPTESPAPTSSSAPTASPTSSPTPTSEATPAPLQSQTPSPAPDPTPAPTILGDDTGSQDESGTVGNTTIDTGDGSTSATITNTGGTNQASITSGSGESVGIINSGNGSSSDNSGSVTLVDGNQLNQTNQAVVVNDLDLATNTGNNTASNNVGDSTIKTGDANTTATVVNSLNTNLAGAVMAEFNVVDDQQGDIILDFAAGCVSGCSAFGDAEASNTDNGADSTNTASIDSVAETTTFQQNDATVENNLTLSSDSGSNTASANTKGDNTIDTGDANTSASILNFANNNLAGNVLYGVVNIFGNLVGDIVLPDNYAQAPANTSGSQTLAANTGNGADSTNTAVINQTNTDETFQTNSADIENNLLLSANSGDNQTSANTGGNSFIDSGDTKAQASVLNIANTNIDGGTWWLVIVNEAGQWIGKILGAPEGSNLAGSEGTEFIVNDAGEVIAVNANNGAGSTNTSSIDQTATNTTTQTNNAKIVNNLDLSANTGGNSTSKNTNGDNSIKTGDATVIASIVNFVNNNIKTNGRIVVTVVNVFGSWVGDFVTPGTHKQNDLALTDPTPTPTTTPEIGGLLDEASDQEEQISTTDENDSDSNVTKTSPKRRKTTVIQETALAQVLPTTTIYRKPLILSAVDSVEGMVDDAITQPATAAKPKPFQINLAWLMLLLPPTSLWAIAKNRAFLASLLLSLVVRA